MRLSETASTSSATTPAGTDGLPDFLRNLPRETSPKFYSFPPGAPLRRPGRAVGTRPVGSRGRARRVRCSLSPLPAPRSRLRCRARAGLSRCQRASGWPPEHAWFIQCVWPAYHAYNVPRAHEFGGSRIDDVLFLLGNFAVLLHLRLIFSYGPHGLLAIVRLLRCSYRVPLGLCQARVVLLYPRGRGSRPAGVLPEHRRCGRTARRSVWRRDARHGHRWPGAITAAADVPDLSQDADLAATLRDFQIQANQPLSEAQEMELAGSTLELTGCAMSVFCRSQTWKKK